MDNPQMSKLVRALEQIGNGLNYIGKSIDKLSDGNGPNKGTITLLAKSIDSAGKEIAHSINNLDANRYEFKQKPYEKSEEQKYEQEIEDLAVTEYNKTKEKFINNPQEIKFGDIIYHIHDCKLFSYQPESNYPSTSLSHVKDVDGKSTWIDVKLCRKATEQEIEWFQIYTKEKTK